MDCRSFQNRLDDYLEGRLDVDERREAERHVRDCARCRETVEILEIASAAPVDDAPADLAGAILAETSGPSCGRARELLCDYVDRSAAPVDAELVGLHLGTCGECAATAAALARLAADLPELAEIEPDPGFVDDVLARTLPWRQRLARRLPRLAEIGASVVRRPRFALEAAYVGTLVLVLAVGPSTLASVPGWAMGIVKTEPAAEIGEPVATGLNDLWKVAEDKTSGLARGLRDDLATRYERTGETRSELRRQRNELLDAAREADPARAVSALKGIGTGLGTLSRQFASDGIDEQERVER